MSFDAELALEITKAYEKVRTYDNGGDIKLANVIKDISDRKNISKDEIALILRSKGMANVADEYLKQHAK